MTKSRSAVVYSEHRSICPTNLTCSLTSSRLLGSASSPHLAKNNSPKNGFKGFFSLPMLSLRLLYCCFSVLRNHLRTATARCSGSDMEAGLMSSAGSETQYAEYSVSEVGLRMKGGAVRVERSPEKEEMVLGHDVSCLSTLRVNVGDLP